MDLLSQLEAIASILPDRRFLSRLTLPEVHFPRTATQCLYLIHDGAIMAPMVVRVLLDQLALRRDGGMTSSYDNHKSVPRLCSPTSIKGVSYRGPRKSSGDYDRATSEPNTFNYHRALIRTVSMYLSMYCVRL